MEKPNLKAIGLGIGEDAIISILDKVVKPYAKYYVLDSANKFDDTFLPFIDGIVDAIKEQAEKIDPSDNVPVA